MTVPPWMFARTAAKFTIVLLDIFVVQQIGFCTLMTQVHMFHYYNYYHLPY